MVFARRCWMQDSKQNIPQVHQFFSQPPNKINKGVHNIFDLYNIEYIICQVTGFTWRGPVASLFRQCFRKGIDPFLTYFVCFQLERYNDGRIIWNIHYPSNISQWTTLLITSWDLLREAEANRRTTREYWWWRRSWKHKMLKLSALNYSLSDSTKNIPISDCLQ